MDGASVSGRVDSFDPARNFIIEAHAVFFYFLSFFFLFIPNCMDCVVQCSSCPAILYEMKMKLVHFIVLKHLCRHYYAKYNKL